MKPLDSEQSASVRAFGVAFKHRLIVEDLLVYLQERSSISEDDIPGQEDDDEKD